MLSDDEEVTWDATDDSLTVLGEEKAAEQPWRLAAATLLGLQAGVNILLEEDTAEPSGNRSASKALHMLTHVEGIAEESLKCIKNDMHQLHQELILLRTERDIEARIRESQAKLEKAGALLSDCG